MEKIDFKKQLSYYSAKAGKPQIVEVPTMNYLIVDGKGDPNTSTAFTEAIEALYKVSYTLKFMIKKSAKGINYGVMPLEALWWADDMNDYLLGNKDKWLWSAIIMQPEYVTEALYKEALAIAADKKDLPALSKMRFEPITEGLCAQVMYVGPYDQETETISQLHTFAKEQGYGLNSKHHEIYMNDMRKTAPEKLKTIIRQPIIKK